MVVILDNFRLATTRVSEKPLTTPSKKPLDTKTHQNKLPLIR